MRYEVKDPVLFLDPIAIPTPYWVRLRYKRSRPISTKESRAILRDWFAVFVSEVYKLQVNTT